MFYKSSILTAIFVLLSISAAVAAETPIDQISALNPQLKLETTDQGQLNFSENLDPDNLATAHTESIAANPPATMAKNVDAAIESPIREPDAATPINQESLNASLTAGEASYFSSLGYILPVGTPDEVLPRGSSAVQNSTAIPQVGMMSNLPPMADQVPAASTPIVPKQIDWATTDLSHKLALGYTTALNDILVPEEDRVIAQLTSSPAPTPPEPKKWAIGIHAQASTTGFIGVDAGYKFSPNLHARLGINTVGAGFSYSSSGVDYNANLSPTNIHLLGDYFPFGGGLRFTGGLVIQNNRFTATGKSNSNAQITINGTPYNTTDIGTVSSEGSFNSGIAPYLGIGFGTPISSGFGFNLDAGVMFAGSPSIKLTANPNPALPAALQTQIQNDLAAQEQKTNNDIKSFTAYPVISLGVSYAF